MDSEQANPKFGEIHTIRSFAATEPAFNEGGLRWIVFRHKTQLVDEGAIFFVGKRLFINRDQFIDVLKTGSLES